MRIKAVFMNQWHQPVMTKQADLGTPGDLKTVPVPPGAIFVRVEIEDESDAG